MNDQRGEVPSLSALLAPSMQICWVEGPRNGDTIFYKTKLKRSAPSAAYIVATHAEGRRLPEQKTKPLHGPIDAEDYPASLQIFYVKLAAKDVDWRAMRGTKPTPRMLGLFVIARAKYIAWKKRRDEEEEREEALPKEWFEIEPGRFVLASSEEKARALLR